MVVTCNCGMVHRFGEQVRCVRCGCGHVVHGDCDRTIQPEAKISSPGEWPLWAKLVRKCSKSGELGVGDTVERIAAKFGGEFFKQWVENLGLPCGCTDRQHEWNASFPYVN